MLSRYFHSSLSIALPTICCAFLAIPAMAYTADNEQVSSLLSEVKTQAVILSADATTMESYTRSNLNWQTHAAVVNQMRTHINEAGKELSKLQELRKSASPWQGVAIDRIEPLLRELADNTTKAINYINEKPERLFLAQYKSYLEANADTSSRLAQMIGDFVDYGRSRGKMDSLAEKLELPAPRK